MPARPRPSLLRTTTARLAVAGAAGLASMLVVAPVAVAAPDDPTSPGTTDSTQTTDSTLTTEASQPDSVENPATSSDDPTGDPTGEPTGDPTSTTDDPSGDPTLEPGTPKVGRPDQKTKVGTGDKPRAQAVEPDFGLQKYRVGVQVADGSYVPAGTTTAGTTFTITETGPNVSSGTRTFTCTTEASTQQDPSTATYCLNPASSSQLRSMAKAAAAADVEVDPNDSSAPSNQLFTAEQGSTVTITQTTAADNLVLDPEVTTIQPCSADLFIFCLDGSGGPQQTKVLYSNLGLPPVAVDDAAKTREGRAVDIEVLANDDTVNGAPVTGLDVISDPDHGTAKVDGESVTYSPTSGFTGTDTFDYRLTTANGTSTATVTVRVRAAADVSDGSTDATTPDAVLPDTGGADKRLLGYAALMLAGGGWLTARGRRRPRDAHALTD
jgi:LPXTG-motif cell wall-anchored protein